MNKKLPNSSPFFFYFQAPKEVACVNDGDFQKFLAAEFPDALGISERIVDSWVAYLKKHEVSMVTTNVHILNLIDDDVAETQVVVPTKYGFALFGDMPELVKRLDALGPGEAICDTELETVTPIPSNILGLTASWVD